MKAPPRQVATLVVVTLALVGVLGYQLWDVDPADGGAVPSQPLSSVNAETANTVQVTSVKLEALTARHAVTATPTRDPFRYRMKPPPTPPPKPVLPTTTPDRPVRPTTPPPERITLKYLGYALGPAGTRVAVLHDGSARPPLLGKQGDVIAGRYRLLRVEADNVEIAYLDGTGRSRLGKGQ